MSKRTVIFFAVLLCLALTAVPMFAAGKGEAGGGAATTTAKALLPWTGDPVTYKGFAADLGIKEDPNAPVTQAYRATTGKVTIQWDTAPWNDYDTKMNLFLASGDMPDIMWCRDSVPKANLYGPKGLFLDWNVYKDYMPNMQKWVAKFSQVNNVLTADGKRYAINDITTAEYVGEGWFYQGAILSKAGITTPPTTMDELMADMKAVKAKVPGADGYLSYWGLGYMMQAFGTAFNVPSENIYYDPASKKWVYGATMNANYKKLIQYLHDGYAAGVFNPDAMGGAITDDKVSEMISAGNYGFIYFYYGETVGKWDPSKNQTPPAGMKGMRPPSYSGQTYYRITVPHDSVPYWGYMANAKVKNPELLAAYIDNVMSEKTYELFEWGLEGKTFTKASDGSYQYLPEYNSTIGGILGGQKLQAMGVGELMDPRYIHYNDYKKIWFGKYFSRPGDIGREACAADIKMLQSGKAIPIIGYPTPLMTADQNDEISKIMTPINTFVSEQRAKFVTGDRPMSEWDDFIAQVNKMGDVAKVLGYYTSGKQFPMGDRLYPDLPADLK